jgi:hypothetical protein
MKGVDTFIFHAAIRKYTPDVWDHVVLETHETETLVKAAEIKLITEHRTFYIEHPDLGYNMTRGGEGLSGFKHRDDSRAKTSQSLRGNRNGAGNKGRKWSDDQRARISQTLTGRKRSVAEIKKISASLKGNTRGRGNKGRSLTPEHIAKLKLAALTREAKKRASK